MNFKTAMSAQAQGGIPNEDRAEILHRFGHSAAVLRDVLYDDRVVDEQEFVFIDKHFQILQLAYLRWKRKHRPTDETQSLM
jgi:hypothetical protein